MCSERSLLVEREREREENLSLSLLLFMWFQLESNKQRIKITNFYYMIFVFHIYKKERKKHFMTNLRNLFFVLFQGLKTRVLTDKGMVTFRVPSVQAKLPNK